MSHIFLKKTKLPTTCAGHVSASARPHVTCYTIKITPELMSAVTVHRLLMLHANNDTLDQGRSYTKAYLCPR